MTKLKKYSTLSDWETAKGGGDLEYPSVGLIEEDNIVVYMTPRIHALPIKAVFYDSATGRFVKLYPGQITEAIPTYTPIGVEVVPAEHDVYGTGQAGIMSLTSMSYTTPDTGSSSRQSIRWGGYPVDISLPNYGVANYIGIGSTLNNGVVQGTYSDPYLPSDQHASYTGLDGISGYYGSTTSYYQAPSPYNADGSRNEAYYTTAYSTANALSDFDGLGNTKVLTELATGQSDWKTASTITNSKNEGYYPAACCCWRFHTAGTEQGQWYLPAAGEMGYVINRILAINTTIDKVISIYPSVNAVALPRGGSHLTSSEKNNYYARSIGMSNCQVYFSSKDYNYNPARAFLRL